MPVIGKCHKCLEINLVHFVLAQFHSKKAMGQPLCFDIEYWRSCGPFHLSGAKWKYLHRITVTFLNFNRIKFHLNGFQPHHPPVILTIHTVTCVHCSLFFHHVNFFHHRRRHFFWNIWFKRGSVVYSWIYQFFSFFSCERNASGKSNCNRSFRGQPAGWNRLLLVTCTSTRVLPYKSTN